MFEHIPKEVATRMDYLQALDKEHRGTDIPHVQRLRQIPPETGKFIALLAVLAPEGTYLEIGTSGGYSALWLSLACREAGRKLVTFELMEEKIKLAKETFKVAGVEEMVELVEGDARKYLDDYKNVSFCFLDPEKEVYSDCYDKIIPNMIAGGILVADNAISHKDALAPFLKRVMSDNRVDAVVVPIGRGELLCRKL